MFEHHENYDRYIPDVMLKKHKKHEEYLNDVYAGMSHEEIYKSKLGTVEDALAIIESGDCIVNSIHGCEPRLFYRNLHRIADRIDPNNPVELWSEFRPTCSTRLRSSNRYETPSHIRRSQRSTRISLHTTPN